MPLNTKIQDAQREVRNAHEDAVEAAEAVEKARGVLAQTEHRRREAEQGFRRSLDALSALLTLPNPITPEPT